MTNTGSIRFSAVKCHVRWRLFVRAGLLLVPCFLVGCAAFKPMSGVPAAHLPELLSESSRTDRKTINFRLLQQRRPPEYLVDTNDVLGIYIEGVLGNEGIAPPVYTPNSPGTEPSIGYPIKVRTDGTISLPLADPIAVRGLTIPQIEQRIREIYVEDPQRNKPGILNGANDRIIVSLQQKRTYSVTVVRQEAAGNDVVGSDGVGTVNIGTVKRGTGRVLRMPAYENDVLHALMMTGGLPGLDAENTIYVIRNSELAGLGQPPEFSPVSPLPDLPVPAQPTSVPAIPPRGAAVPPGRYPYGTPTAVRGQSPGFSVPPDVTSTPGFGYSPANALPLQSPPQSVEGPWSLPPGIIGDTLTPGTVESPGVVRIPIQYGPGAAPFVREQDIVLHDGDIVFIESRDHEVYYTGGLLGGGQFVLPRDFDMDVIAAVSRAQGNRLAGAPPRSIGGVSALNADVTIGASDVVILREAPNGAQFKIKVNIYDALENPTERVLIQPGDVVMLRYTPIEAGLAFIERHVLDVATLGLASTIWSNNN